MARSIHPRLIQIDASSHCQLACPSCPTATGAVRPVLKAGHLSLADFQSLLDKNPWLAEVELSNYGEMFLNPRLVDILRYAQERQVVLHADNGTNLNFASEQMLEALVKYKFRSLTCSIDGASQETYSQYRLRGNFDRVIGHIRRINAYKRQYNSGLPLLKWQFIVFGHNEHEVEAARKMAAELGMQFAPKLSWDDAYSPIRNAELVKISTRATYTSRAEYRKASGLDYMRSICHQMWHAPVLNWDGRVLGCCRNFWGDYGSNAFEEPGLLDSLNNEKMRYAREMLMGHAPAREDIPCTTCDLYHVMRDDGSWIQPDELEQQDPGILLSVVPDTALTGVTHVDVFIVSGHTVDPVYFARPPQALRFMAGKDFSVCFSLPGPGDYTIHALPKRLDSTYRSAPVTFPPSTFPISIPGRPVCQEIGIRLV